MLLWVLLTVSNCKKLKRPGQTLKDKKTNVVRDHDYDYNSENYNSEDYNYDNYYTQKQNLSFDVPHWQPGPCSTGQPGCLPKHGAEQCFLNKSNQIQTHGVVMQTDNSVVMEYLLPESNRSRVGFAIFDTNSTESCSKLCAEQIVVEIGSRAYTAITKQFKLVGEPVFQFQIAQNTSSLVLNVISSGCKEANKSTNCRLFPLTNVVTNSITPNGTILETKDPYDNNEFWGKHVRCQAGEHVWYRFLWLELETCCDYLTLTYNSNDICVKNHTLNSWEDTESELLIVSFESDGSVVRRGFKMETQCRPGTSGNDFLPTKAESELLQCFKDATTFYISPVDNEEESDFTDCVRRDYFNITDFCDGGSCQMPKGAYCPGNQWFTPSKHSPRILGGEAAVPHSWPWIVQLVDQSGDLVCGGTLITDTWVLTAAHCCEGKHLTGGSVNIGDHLIDSNGDEVASIKINRVFIDPEYHPWDVRSDFCLLELSEPADVDNEKVQVACLPEEHVDLTNARCWTAGWGQQLDQEFELHSISLKVYDDATCKNMSFFREVDLDVEFCAGNLGMENRDSCYGDSGGPLMCQYPGSNLTTLYGVTSWGEDCGLPNYLGVYAKVSSRIDWIDDVIKGRALPFNFADTWTFWATTTTIFSTGSSVASTVLETSSTDPTSIFNPSTSLPNFRCSGNRWFNTSDSFNRIVDGNIATEGNWPWIVNLSIGKKTQYNLRTGSSSSAHCVGSILTDRFILTAGKCCVGSVTSEINIYTGSNNFYDGDLYESEEINVHPDYNERFLDNDLCLVKTKKHIVIDNEKTSIVCMPETELELEDQDSCWVAGWGRESTWSQTQQSVMLKSMSTGVEYCNDSQEYLALLCTKYAYASPKLCSGDLGAPLICLYDQKLYQLGITIADDQCSSNEWSPKGLFTDMRRYLGWLDAVITSDRNQEPDQEASEHHPDGSWIQGPIDADTVGETIGNFFSMVGSLFNYLDQND